MPHRAQRWMFWLFVAWIAFQIYVVREWLAAVLLLGVVFAGVLVLVAVALLANAAGQRAGKAIAASWQVGRSAATGARMFLAKTVFEKTILAKAFLAGSNPPQ